MPSSLYSPQFQAVLDAATAPAQPAFPSPADWRDQWIYFLMVDRFNNAAAPPRHLPFDDPDCYQYQGGKFSGVRAQLLYIKGLGAGAIWLSPVLKNAMFDQGSYHGYGIQDFLSANPFFAILCKSKNVLRYVCLSVDLSGVPNALSSSIFSCSEVIIWCTSQGKGRSEKVRASCRIDPWECAVHAASFPLVRLEALPSI